MVLSVYKYYPFPSSCVCIHHLFVSYYILTAEIFNNLENFLIFCFRDNNPLYLKDGRLFNSFLMGSKGIPVKRLNKKNKSYDTMRMTAIELKI